MLEQLSQLDCVIFFAIKFIHSFIYLFIYVGHILQVYVKRNLDVGLGGCI